MSGIIGAYNDDTNCLIPYSDVHLDGRISGSLTTIGSFSQESGKTYLTVTSSATSPTFKGVIGLYTKLGNL